MYAVQANPEIDGKPVETELDAAAVIHAIWPAFAFSLDHITNEDGVWTVPVPVDLDSWSDHEFTAADRAFVLFVPGI